MIRRTNLQPEAARFRSSALRSAGAKVRACIEFSVAALSGAGPKKRSLEGQNAQPYFRLVPSILLQCGPFYVPQKVSSTR
jgi:hypothetical protein